MPHDIFKQIVKFIGGKFPANLDLVLKSSGYDCLYSISHINEEDIHLIEEYITNNPTPIIGTEYCPNIEEITEDFQFKLKPGHKKFLLSLVNVIDDIKKLKREKKKKTIEVDLNNKSPPNVKDLSKKVFDKLTKFCVSLSPSIVFDESCVTRFRRENNKTTCSIICTICKKPIICDYTSYWNISNLQAHLKNHVKKSHVPQNSEVNSLHQSNAIELDRLLRD